MLKEQTPFCFLEHAVPVWKSQNGLAPCLYPSNQLILFGEQRPHGAEYVPICSYRVFHGCHHQSRARSMTDEFMTVGHFAGMNSFVIIFCSRLLQYRKPLRMECTFELENGVGHNRGVKWKVWPRYLFVRDSRQTLPDMVRHCFQSQKVVDKTGIAVVNTCLACAGSHGYIHAE